MVVRVTLEIEVDTELNKSDIEDRFKCIDYDSALADCFDYALDEFGEVEKVELNDVYAV